MDHIWTLKQSLYVRYDFWSRSQMARRNGSNHFAYVQDIKRLYNDMVPFFKQFMTVNTQNKYNLFTANIPNMITHTLHVDLLVNFKCCFNKFHTLFFVRNCKLERDIDWFLGRPKSQPYSFHQRSEISEENVQESLSDTK